MVLGTTVRSPARTARLPIPAPGAKGAGPSETRARILEAAAQLYRRIGHRKTTVADIAKDVSMSPANVYRFFASKRAIELAVVGVLLDEVVRAAEQAMQRDGSTAERLRAVLHAVERLNAARYVQHPRLHELMMTAARENWSVVRSCSDVLESTLTELISEGQACGEFSNGDPVIAARCVLGATGGVVSLPVATGASSSRPTLDQMIDFCIGALRPAPQRGDDHYSTQKAER